jgi:hypothetical protein
MAEDVSFMEIQQAAIDRGDEFEPVAIKADATLVQARRIVQRLLREERDGGPAAARPHSRQKQRRRTA